MTSHVRPVNLTVNLRFNERASVVKLAIATRLLRQISKRTIEHLVQFPSTVRAAMLDVQVTGDESDVDHSPLLGNTAEGQGGKDLLRELIPAHEINTRIPGCIYAA